MNNFCKIFIRPDYHDEKYDYAGFDPYDMLNSPLSGVLSPGTRFGCIALPQFWRRSPINLRTLFDLALRINFIKQEI